MGTIDLTGFKARLGEKGTESHAVLQDVLDDAIGYFERETGVRVRSVTSVTKMLPSAGGVSVYLPESAESVTSVETRSDASSDWSVLASTSWEHSGKRITRTDGGTFPRGAGLVRVVYPAGFAASEVPGEYCSAIYAIAAHFWTNSRRVVGGIPPEESERPISLPGHVWRVLKLARGVPRGF